MEIGNASHEDGTVGSFCFCQILEVDRKVGPRTGRPRTDGRTDGRTGGGLRPPRSVRRPSVRGYPPPGVPSGSGDKVLKRKYFLSNNYRNYQTIN